MIFGVLGLVGPASSAGAAPGPVVSTEATPRHVEPAGEVGTQVTYYWVYCRRSGGMTIILRETRECSLPGSVGYVALDVIPGGRRMELCSFRGIYMGVLDPEGPAAPITYSDHQGDGCYIRNIGYPIRKFRAAWGDSSSEWRLP
jgi:hypothetical protein